MRAFIICTVMILAGCSTPVPVKVTFPEAPPQLLEPCAQLEIIDKPEVRLSELMNTVVRNYTHYHNCSDLVKIWQAWYAAQRDVFNSVGKDK